VKGKRKKKHLEERQTPPREALPIARLVEGNPGVIFNQKKKKEWPVK